MPLWCLPAPSLALIRHFGSDLRSSGASTLALSCLIDEPVRIRQEIISLHFHLRPLGLGRLGRVLVSSSQLCCEDMAYVAPWSSSSPFYLLVDHMHQDQDMSVEE
jgi:hypothetical protein